MTTKFYGEVGYAEAVETSPGVWEEVITERSYYGDVIRPAQRTPTSDQINDDVVPSNQISIMADAYAYGHWFAIKYIKWMGASWKVTRVEVQRPRLVLSLGGVYRESRTAGTTPATT